MLNIFIIIMKIKVLKRKNILAIFLIVLILFVSSCDTFDLYLRKGLDGVNLYELTVYGEALGNDIKVVELRGFNVDDFRTERVSYYLDRYKGILRPHKQKNISYIFNSFDFFC